MDSYCGTVVEGVTNDDSAVTKMGMGNSRFRSRLASQRPIAGWLVRDGKVLASVEVAEGHIAKTRGLLGRDSMDGAMVIRGARSVHSFSMGFDLDVAFLDADGIVIRTLRLHRNRVTVPVWRAKSVLEAEAGSFGHWELKVGDQLEVREA